MKETEVKKVVREGYAWIAKQGDSCCSSSQSCCGSTDLAEQISKSVGYSSKGS